MKTAQNTHPDFSKGPLTSAQRAWLASKGIVAKAHTYGFYFTRGARWIAPIAANDLTVSVVEHDTHEDGDGEFTVATVKTLREALRILAA